MADTAFPGGVLLAAKDGQIFLHEAFGYHTYNKTKAVTRGDIYDLASITKVIATTSAIMQLIDQKKISLDDKVVDHLPKFIGKQSNHFNQKSQTTIRHLMTHTAGLPDFKQYFLIDGDAQTRLDSVMNTEPQFGLERKNGLLGCGINHFRKVGRSSGAKCSLDLLVDSLVLKPLGMTSTYYNPPKERMKRIVPTEISEHLQNRFDSR